MITEQELLELKKQIDTAKTTVSELTGKQSAQMEELEKSWGCTTVKQAEKKVEKMEGDIDDLDQQIKDGLKELEEKYDV